MPFNDYIELEVTEIERKCNKFKQATTINVDCDTKIAVTGESKIKVA